MRGQQWKDSPAHALPQLNNACFIRYLLFRTNFFAVSFWPNFWIFPETELASPALGLKDCLFTYH